MEAPYLVKRANYLSFYLALILYHINFVLSSP
nr:MAG TPA: hypothetical protein [Caudoviricetes sp.]DAO06802.1 MAG TPA: hypothetical protein [Caudoviricetes sp.]